MGNYGGLPVTGAAITLGTAHLTTPAIALVGAAVVVIGFLVVRLARPHSLKVRGAK
jgi:hypothetical protein